MRDAMLIAQLVTFGNDGHSRYRIHSPARALAALPGVTVIDCDLYHRASTWLTEHADLLILHGVHPDHASLAHQRRNRGQGTIMEASDDFLDIQGWNPFSLGWLDRTLQDQFYYLIGQVDGVQTSTTHLAQRWQPHSRDVRAFPNLLDECPPLPPMRCGPSLTIGWAGSLTHLADWLDIAPTLQHWLLGNPDISLAVMSDEHARGFIRLPVHRFRFVPRGSWTDYRDFLQTLDIGLVPLVPSPFNLGRTDLKYREYAAHGVAGVYASEGPYPHTVQPGDTGLLYRSPAELCACLDRLVGDEPLRKQLRQRAYDTVRQDQQSQDVQPRLDWYRSLCTPKNSELPSTLTQSAHREGNYWSFVPSEVEQTVALAFRESLADEKVALLEAQRDHLPAIRARVRQHLVRQQFESAGRLLAVLPETPTMLADVAQVVFSQGEVAQARQKLERALALNPSYFTAWNMLIRLLDREDPVAAALAAQRAHRNQPRNYMVALATLKYVDPDTAWAVARTLLERFAPTFDPAEMPYAASAFGRVFQELANQGLTRAVDTLRIACQVFPDSARLHDLCARSLHPSVEANQHWQRAMELDRAATLHQLDFATEEEAPLIWSIADYVRRHRGES